MYETSTETLGIALIGYGDHCAQSHAPYLGQSALCKIIGVAEQSSERLAAADEQYDPKIITADYTELLEDDEVDAVVITTGDSLHFPIAREAIKAGKHVLSEKPAAVALRELIALPGLFAAAERKGLQFSVCHPREFGEGPWQTAASLIGNPERISQQFNVGPMGKLLEMRHDCHYTLPDGKHELHTSFADDKLNHTIVSVMRALPKIRGFNDAVLLDNGPTQFDARLRTIPDNPAEQPVVVKASGRRSAHKWHHGEGVYRDWIEAIFEEGVLRVEPALGNIQLTYGKQEQEPILFDTDDLYENMFAAFNESFVRSALGREGGDPLPTRTKIVGTAAAILMQIQGNTGEITEDRIQRIGTTLAYTGYGHL